MELSELIVQKIEGLQQVPGDPPSPQEICWAIMEAVHDFNRAWYIQTVDEDLVQAIIDIAENK